MIGLHADYASFTIHGMSDQARVLGYDIYVYTYFGFRSADGRTLFGETNILNLVNSEDFDAFIIHKGLIPEEHIRDRIEEICRTSGKPYFDIEDQDLPETDYPMWNDREKFCTLTEHLITVHHFQKIYCITGYKGFHQSENRLLGYRDAMRAHGIEPKPEWEFYGDFWKEYARSFADRLAAGEIPMPEAIACGCTAAAITLIDRLRAHHIRVPEDVAVVGYDFAFEGEMCEPTITSISLPYYNNGIKAVCRIHKMLTGETITPIPLRQESIRIGGSCGCHTLQDGQVNDYRETLLEKLEYRDLFRNSGLQGEISKSENAHAFFHRLSSFHYVIRGLHSISYFLCDDWDGIHNIQDNEYRRTGYSDTLFTYFQRGRENLGFSMLPLRNVPDFIREDTPAPSTFFFFPLHYEDRVFGFVGMQFRENRFTPDEQFWSFLEMLNHSLETIRIRQYMSRFSERIRLAVIRDPLTGTYNRRGFEELSAEIYEHAAIQKERFLLTAIRICNLSEINQSQGYAEADKLLLRVAEILNESCKGNEICCHVRPGLFYVIGSHAARQSHTKKIAEYFTKRFPELEAQYLAQIDIELYNDYLDEKITLSHIISQLETSLNKKHLNQQKRIEHRNHMKDLRKAIYTEPQRKWTVDEMAKRMMLSRAYFQRMYKRYFGISVSADIITARIEMAKKLLLNHKSICETAEQCGYSSDVYFMHQFKKETGLTPSEFLNKARNDQ